MIVQTVTVEQYTIRDEVLNGKNYIVVPVVMMVEGVHNGSRGPILHLAEDLGRIPEAWDGRPVVIGHPQVDGNFVSANSPAMVESTVGTVYNTHMDGLRLKAEVWIDTLKIIAVSPTALTYIKSGRHLEVSVGVFSDTVNTTGVHNNEQYEGIARNHRPDHLALLPGERGACSWTDGCGIRANQEKLNANEMKELDITAEKELIRVRFANELENNQQGLMELSSKLRSKLDSMDNDQAVYFLEEMYDGHIIYKRRERETGVGTLHKQGFSVNADDTIEFTGDPVRVRKDIQFVTVNKKTRTINSKGETMSEKKTPCCPDKVDALIKNKLSNFEEADKEWLLTQDEATLEKLLPKEPEKVVAPVVNKEKPVDMSDYISKDSIRTVDDYIAHAPVELQDSLRAGMQLNAERKASLVQFILDNAVKGSWTKEELEAETSARLEKYSKQFAPAVNYEANLAHTEITDNAVPPMKPSGFATKEEKEDK